MMQLRYYFYVMLSVAVLSMPMNRAAAERSTTKKNTNFGTKMKKTDINDYDWTAEKKTAAPQAIAAPVDPKHAHWNKHENPEEDAATRIEKNPVCKKLYTLFTPMPNECLADMVTDRPHLTDSTNVIEPGHVQIETEYAAMSINGSGNATDFLFLGPIAKIGLVNRVDIEAGYNLMNFTPGDDGKYTLEGGDNVFTRMKINYWGGNTGKNFTAAFAPVLWIPTKKEKKYEGGGVFFFTFGLPHEIEIELNTAYYVVENSAQNGYDQISVFTVNFEKELTGNIEGYQELYTEYNISTQTFSPTYAAGIVIQLNPGATLDMGMRLGLRSHMTPVNLFVGGSFKF